MTPVSYANRGGLRIGAKRNRSENNGYPPSSIPTLLMACGSGWGSLPKRAVNVTYICGLVYIFLAAASVLYSFNVHRTWWRRTGTINNGLEITMIG